MKAPASKIQRRLTKRGIYSLTRPGKSVRHHPVIEKDGRVHCDCLGFQFHYAKHNPTVATPQYWCVHVTRLAAKIVRNGEDPFLSLEEESAPLAPGPYDHLEEDGTCPFCFDKAACRLCLEAERLDWLEQAIYAIEDERQATAAELYASDMACLGYVPSQRTQEVAA